MSIRYDHKGKYFTEVKRKEPVRARIQTADAQIIGTIHVHPENRLLDEINHRDLFLPVTDAVIDRSENRIQTSFIAINKEQIIWMVPLEEED
jgi:hypothetical protein